MEKKTVIIFGAGPAGLTAAYELLMTTDFKPIIYEMSDAIGGISRTVNYKGNRIDIGGHRFFSKSDIVMNWWQKFLSVQGHPSLDDILLKVNRHYSNSPNAPDPEKSDKVMLLRNRISRIFYSRKFFNYPVSLNWNTISNLGFFRMFKIGISYIKAHFFPVRNEHSLEDFLINRFGKILYETFFRDYTTKVWGVSPAKIKPEWGAQRIKGLSIAGVLKHAIKSAFSSKKEVNISQKETETSLIDQFMYPKYGPGQLWEEVANQVIKLGGEIHQNHRISKISLSKDLITSVEILHVKEGNTISISGDYYISTMPICDLIASMGNSPPKSVIKVAEGLQYRDFVTVGLLLNEMKVKNRTKTPTINNIVPDNWIYVQENDVLVGRLQIFNNWSPYMVQDINKTWIGLEYFCNEGDAIWSRGNDEFIKLAVDELTRIDIIDPKHVLDAIVIRSPKTYPAYFGTYDQFDEIRNFTDNIKNLFLIGRNGMHRYNNMDHSMLTAMEAVRNIREGILSRENIWQVNTEQEYHEKK